jgi:hypothetical protein
MNTELFNLFYYHTNHGIAQTAPKTAPVIDTATICGVCGESDSDCDCSVGISDELRARRFFLCDEPASKIHLFHYIRENEDGTVERISSPSCQSFKNWLTPKVGYIRFDANDNIVDRREFENVLSFVEWFTA